MIPVYVLNLARSPERRAFMSAALTRLGVESTFVKAVDGRACRSSRPPRAALSRAETALILSHRKAWRRFLSTDAGFAVVLEDDTHFGQGFAEVLESDWSGWEFDAVKLETLFHAAWLSRRGEPLGFRALHRLGAEHLGAAAYLVSRQGARKLLRATRPLSEPVDHSLFGRRAIFEGAIRAYQLAPAIVVQDNLHPDPRARREWPSTLHEADRGAIAARTRDAKPRGLARWRREAARLVEQMRRWAKLAPTMRRRIVPFA